MGCKLSLGNPFDGHGARATIEHGPSLHAHAAVKGAFSASAHISARGGMVTLRHRYGRPGPSLAVAWRVPNVGHVAIGKGGGRWGHWDGGSLYGPQLKIGRGR